MISITSLGPNKITQNKNAKQDNNPTAPDAVSFPTFASG